MKFWQTFKLLDLWLYMIPCAFLLAGNVNVASAEVPPRCWQIENLTTYKSVAIDNGITGYYIVLANKADIGIARERTGDLYNDGWPSIFNLGDDTYGDIKVYLIPNSLDIDKLTCRYPNIEHIGDKVGIDGWCEGFNGEKYSIGKIPSKYFKRDIDFKQVYYDQDIGCTKCSNDTQCVIHHYEIKKNLLGEYVLDLVEIEKSCDHVGCYRENVISINNPLKGKRFNFICSDFKGLFHTVDYPRLPDDNIQKFVGVNQPFSNKSYEPADLVPLQGHGYISAQPTHTLRKEAADNLEKMANDFYATFGKNIVIASAYRSYNYQKNSISESCKRSGRCAREGESEHQLGLAVDLREATNEQKFLSKYQKYYDRLHDNAHLYGFHQSYQNGREFDGYYIEPRHRRYLGTGLATKLHNRDITFTQYVNLNNSRNK